MKVSFRPKLGLSKHRYLYYLSTAAGGVEFRVHDNSFNNVVRGVVERVLVHKIDNQWRALDQPEEEVIRQTLRPFELRMRAHAFGLTPQTRRQYVDGCDSRKRAVYEKALEELEADGLLDRDFVMRTFVKCEKINFTLKEDPAPRVIQPLSPKVNIELGKYIRPLEGVLYKLVNQIFEEDFGQMGPVVFKGMNAIQQGEAIAGIWKSFRNPVAIGGDLHRMDQHNHTYAQEFCSRVYRLFYHDKEFKRLITKMMLARGRARTGEGELRYEIWGRLASGRVDTALLNTLMICAMVYSFVKANGFGQAVRVALIANGDDHVLFCERRHLARFGTYRAFLGGLGYPGELEPPVTELERVEFCQCHPVFNGTLWTMVRHPRICMTKDVCTIKPVREETTWNTLRNTIGLSGLALAGHMPVFCELYEHLRRGAGTRVDKDLTMDGMKWLAKGMNMSQVKVTTEARVSFWEAFGVLPDEQEALERFYRSTKPVWTTPITLPRSPTHPLAMGSCL
jgi:hypothetical protein